MFQLSSLDVISAELTTGRFDKTRNGTVGEHYSPPVTLQGLSISLFTVFVRPCNVIVPTRFQPSSEISSAMRGRVPT